MSSSKIDRVMAVLSGRRPDRPPVSFWHHFGKQQRSGEAAVQAHLDHLRTYDLDFLKVMNDNGYPKPQPIQTIQDLDSLTVLNGDEPEFARQLDLISALSSVLAGEVLMSTTLFNAWATLRRLIKPKDKPGPPRLDVGEDEAKKRLRQFLSEDRQVVAKALRIVGESLSNFAARCLDAGADGVFLSVRDDWIDTSENGPRIYDEIVRPTDLQILEAVRGARFNLLHVCGRAVNFEAFAGYPVHVVNWADRAAGPSIAEVRDWMQPAICAGVDNLEVLPHGSPEQCAEQVRDAIVQAGDRPILIAPGCTFDPDQVPRKNLEAICQAAHVS